MGIFIKNPDVERKARELAELSGKSITSAIEEAIDRQLLSPARLLRRKRTLKELHEATDRFRRLSGLDKAPSEPLTKADWDALWPTGIAEIDDQ